VDAAEQRRHLTPPSDQKGATTSPIDPGSISGSSPCTLTTMSQSRPPPPRRDDRARLVRGFREAHIPAKNRGRASRCASRRSRRSLATRRRRRDAAVHRARSSDGRRCRERLAGKPRRSVSGGDDATMLSGGTESTFEPVDAGCTTNTNTVANRNGPTVSRKGRILRQAQDERSW